MIRKQIIDVDATIQSLTKEATKELAAKLWLAM